VSFAGGGTDVPPFPAQEGGLVLSATVNRYAYGALTPRADRAVSVESLDFGIKVEYGDQGDVQLDGQLDLVKAALRKLVKPGASGYDLLLRSGAPPGSGLGSSSAMVVALIGLLADFQELPLADHEIAQLACTIELEDFGIKGGMQDQYAATFGGFNLIEFHGDHVVVNPLRIPTDVVHELEHNMLLYYTGRTRAGAPIIADQTSRLQSGVEQTLEGLRMQRQLATEMKNALLAGRLTDFGELLGSVWVYKKQMSPRATTGFIDEAYKAAIDNGALGGKVTGAGGGGYMLFFCPFERKHRVAEALGKLGGQVSEFEFTPRGLTRWSVRG
jgi:D-glycero-alpha-D-manno-heptose-7-phosphate kinase